MSASRRWRIRETIRKNAEAEGKYIRQTGGSGNTVTCKIRLEPNEPGKGYEFINDIVGGVVPKEYIKPIDQGIQEAMEGGVLAGYEMVDVKVRSTTAAITTSTRTKWPSRSPVRWRSRKLPARRARCCWSR